MEWMAALNMYNYVDVFKSKDVKGSDLLHLDKDKLLVSSFSPHPLDSVVWVEPFMWSKILAEAGLIDSRKISHYL